jgi:hypothetical protein
VVVATRDDLVGQYVGHTAPKTKEMVKKAMGGILLVDEAYYLYNAANDRDYGQESIEILLNVMENNKEDIIVVLAGYKDRMDAFYGFIPVRHWPAQLSSSVAAGGRQVLRDGSRRLAAVGGCGAQGQARSIAPRLLLLLLPRFCPSSRVEALANGLRAFMALHRA